MYLAKSGGYKFWEKVLGFPFKHVHPPAVRCAADRSQVGKEGVLDVPSELRSLDAELKKARAAREQAEQNLKQAMEDVSRAQKKAAAELKRVQETHEARVKEMTEQRRAEKDQLVLEAYQEMLEYVRAYGTKRPVCFVPSRVQSSAVHCTARCAVCVDVFVLFCFCFCVCC